MPAADTEFRGKIRAASTHLDRRATGGIASNLDLMPADSLRPAGAERFEYSFLGGETRGVAFGAKLSSGVGINAFILGKASPGEGVTMILEHPRHALNLDEVNTVSDDAHRERA